MGMKTDCSGESVCQHRTVLPVCIGSVREYRTRDGISGIFLC